MSIHVRPSLQHQIDDPSKSTRAQQASDLSQPLIIAYFSRTFLVLLFNPIGLRWMFITAFLVIV